MERNLRVEPVLASTQALLEPLVLVETPADRAQHPAVAVAATMAAPVPDLVVPVAEAAIPILLPLLWYTPRAIKTVMARSLLRIAPAFL